MPAPLDDITVIAIDSWMASPSAGAILADMGARVIKVEPLTGDPMRDMSRPARVEGALADYDLQFDVDNRGKQSIAVALDQPEGAALVRRLIEKAEVFMCNLLPARQQKFGLDPASIRAVNPRIVHATLTGYGTDGPDAWRPGYDVTAFFGRSGLYDAMREGEAGEVPMARPAQGDHCTGLAFVGAILGALRLAERTGESQVVETSLYETAVWSQATDYAVTAVDRAPVRKRSRVEVLSPTANRYPCGDGKWVVFNMPEIRWWPLFCRAIGREQWIDDPRYVDGRARYRAMHELVPGVDEALSVKSRDEWGPIFDEVGLIWGKVLGIHEVASDPQAEAIGLFPTIEHPEAGTYRSVRIPMRFANATVEPRGPAPTLGADTQAILTEFGFGNAADLLARGIVGEGS